jgi:ankyrin repeat protein
MFEYKTQWSNAERFLGKALHTAVVANDITKVKELLENPELDMSFIWEPLPYELKEKPEKEILLLVRKAPVLFKTKSIEVFRELLKHPNAFRSSGEDVHSSFYTDQNGDTIFHAEIQRPATRGIGRFKELLNVYPEAYAVENNMGVPVYQKVISNDRLDLLEEMIKRNMAQIMGNDILWAIVTFAPREPDKMEMTNKMLDLLEKHNWDINAKDSRDGTPLHWAARIGNEAMIEILLGRGVDSQRKDSRGLTYSEELMIQRGQGYSASKLPSDISLS